MTIIFQGNINEDELLVLKKEFDSDDIEILKLHTKSINVQDYISLIFRDFNAITFIRDFILSAFIGALVSKVTNKLKENFKIKGLKFEFEFIKNDGRIIILNFTCPFDDYQIAINEADKIITSDFIENLPDNKIIWISFKNNKLFIKTI